ncbi:hypothetical protein GCM10022199_18860 [Marihabitans asiaticum]|uniref:D-alanyl-D-alanine carboxypeptidase-like protein n=1 Tax=Marihabitans asiaticum TaxID=415218 RepID=A0A560W6J0_9MICO|nr:M15 family metallopeptidase [Marihabitans asiaticum]TWD13239.1 D-alanyl-D-alanine carboxypeptidase-like protein [Marihabitans asiaticum]
MPDRFSRRRAAATAALALAFTLPLGTASAEPVAPADPTSGAAGQASDHSESLSSGQVSDQVAAARELAEKIRKDNKAIAAEVEALEADSKKANELLQKYSEAQERYQDAKDEADEAREEARRLRERLEAGREDLREWAVDTYTEAGGYSDTLAFLNIMSKKPSAAGDSAGDLSYLTEERIHSVDLVRLEAIGQAQLARKAEKAEKRAEKAKDEADAARKELDSVVEARKDRIEALRADHAEELEKAGPLAQQLFGFVDSDAQDAQQALTDAMEQAGQDVKAFEGGTPCSNNNELYPNGQIPPNGLCPLLGAAGESLRPEAAAAFNAMTKAYARDMGSPICITDSYRSYSEQVIIKSQRGGWAAAPGTSNHGLGKALDLCGGINNFGSAAHAWMRQNAPLYGWFHPSWAQAGGALPEPWHWEYAG